MKLGGWIIAGVLGIVALVAAAAAALRRRRPIEQTAGAPIQSAPAGCSYDFTSSLMDSLDGAASVAPQIAAAVGTGGASALAGGIPDTEQLSNAGIFKLARDALKCPSTLKRIEAAARAGKEWAKKTLRKVDERKLYLGVAGFVATDPRVKCSACKRAAEARDKAKRVAINIRYAFSRRKRNKAHAAARRELDAQRARCKC